MYAMPYMECLGYNYVLPRQPRLHSVGIIFQILGVMLQEVLASKAKAFAHQMEYRLRGPFRS